MKVIIVSISNLANNIKIKINYNIDQILQQINSCTDPACLNKSNNTAELGALDELRAYMDQTLQQINICKNAICQNEGNNVIVRYDETSATSLLNADQQMSHRNDCSDIAKYVNEGFNIIITGK